MKKKIKQKSSFFILVGILSIIILSFIVIVLALKISNNTFVGNTVTKAQDNLGNPNFCADSCKPDGSRCDLTTPSTESCCDEIQKTGDPFACADWVARGYCSIDQCGTIPEGVNRQRCGAPRWHWCDLCKANSCPGYGEPTKAPKPTQLPTPVVRPTSVPTPQLTATQKTQPPQEEPTTIIRVPPNEPTHPAITNDFQKSRSESVTQQFSFPSIQFPKITFPKININLVELNQNTRKPLDFFEYVFGRIVYYDNLLEYSINQKIRSIVK